MSRKLDLDQLVYDLAEEGNLEEVTRIVKAGGNIQMAMMGAGALLEYEGKEKAEKKKDALAIVWWGLAHGGAFLWTFTQGTKANKFFTMKYNKNISMLREPGEVARGTFNGKNEGKE